MEPLLAGYGLVPQGRVASTAAAASQAAVELGFPVAVKVADRRVVHKTERGLVRVGLASAEQVAAAVGDFERELGRAGVPVLVQPVLRGAEVALGLVRDPVFGPLVMVAAGGVATEVWDDRAFLMPPVSVGDAQRALQSLRIRPLLEGFRGAPPVDLPALQDLVVRLGRLAEDVPQVAELDLNPVLANPDGAFLVDVKVRLATADGVESGQPRQLRRPVTG
jgi:acyl-CoA synthetase (NDP forming)